jgi:hypothetical protein
MGAIEGGYGMVHTVGMLATVFRCIQPASVVLSGLSCWCEALLWWAVCSGDLPRDGRLLLCGCVSRC